ncbi:MAG: tRNA adenosine(34) deaminase TadA [candidate division Zixibacteria bacterium]|nr:tRNA adenosine(34) deaminase TadA [candidate division Zixibacteria bacterium]MDD5427176.1 tRNA adenosine(34) deaminase TadA [candidate division Zixibacteria bacterium]
MNPEKYPDFMALALREAELAFEKNEVPVGAIVVFDDKVIGRGHNLIETLHDATAHAEIIALSAAYAYFNDWRLENCFLFSTLEPCLMCAAAAVHSRIKTIVYGARDPKFGGCGSILNIPEEKKLNHNIEIVSGTCEQEITELMKLFFKEVRQNKRKVN